MSHRAAPRPALSLVVVSFNMRRELARTLRSLAAPYQRDVDPRAYEVIVVDNGSAELPSAEDFAGLGLDLRILSCPRPTRSPVEALNLGLEACGGETIGVFIDGARMASPGLLAAGTRALRLHPRAIVYTQSLSLGYGQQWETVHQSYDQAAEDRLLASIEWPSDGYRLFEIATWPRRRTGETRWAEPMMETNALFMPHALWREVGGYDQAFQSPGGGFASADLFARACALPDTQLIVIVGDATFHQIHCGSAAAASLDMYDRLKSFSREHHRIRKRRALPVTRSYWTFGVAPTSPAPAAGTCGPVGRERRYLELLKQALLNEQDQALEAARLDALGDGACPPRASLDGLCATDRVPAAYTMIGRRRLEDLERCVYAVVDSGIPGDLIECGVWRGGACILMAGVLQARSVTDRRVWVADSFSGLPPPAPDTDDGVDLSAAMAPELAVDLGAVKANFARFGLLDERVRFLPGWFRDTLPSAPIEALAVLRLDADLYSSTMDALTSLYAKVSEGGFVIVDDYNVLPQCARAITDFRAAHAITAPLRRIDSMGVYWRRE